MVTVWTVCRPVPAATLTGVDVVSATTLSAASVTTARTAMVRAAVLLFHNLVVRSTVADAAVTVRWRRDSPGPALSGIRTDSGSVTIKLTFREMPPKKRESALHGATSRTGAV